MAHIALVQAFKAGLKSAKVSKPKVVHNKLLGGWYVVRGKHHTPISGRFETRQAAIDYLGRQFFSGLRTTPNK